MSTEEAYQDTTIGSDVEMQQILASSRENTALLQTHDESKTVSSARNGGNATDDQCQSGLLSRGSSGVHGTAKEMNKRHLLTVTDDTN